MISRASRVLTEQFDNSHVSQLFSTAVYNLVFGELIQAKRDFKKPARLASGDFESTFDSTEYFNSYVAKTYYKTASMISIGCRGIGMIFNMDL